MVFGKKAISETTSFIFLTLIIVLFSSIAYFFLSDELDENAAQIDRNNMEINLKKFDFVSRNIMSYENSTISFPVSFKTGSLIFNHNQLLYQSQVRYEDTNVNCFDSLCYYGSNNFERIYITLPYPYRFANNVSLGAGNYILIISNLKNESKIKINTR